MAKTTYTVTLPNGEVATRKTERTYTHAVVVERHYENGRTSFSKPEWAGRFDLAQKNAAKLDKAEARYLTAKLPEGWTRLLSYEIHVLAAS